MTPLTAKSLSCFVPSGPDYAASRRLFAELGFTEEWESSGYAGFRSGDAQFILQNFHHKEMAENLMLRLVVPDLDAWWLEVSAKKLDLKYPGVKLKPPTDFPWGREVNLIDLAGVCWHVTAS